MTKKIAGIIFALSIIATPLLAGAGHDTAHIIEQLQQQINELQTKIKSLRNPDQPPTLADDRYLRPIGIQPFTDAQPIKKPVSEFLSPVTITMPVFDNNTGDDDVIQINNLRIQSVSGTQFPAIITATNDFGVQCLHYETQESSHGNLFACPVPPSILYQIRIDANTRLLLRNRERATLSDLSVGNRINVFGFIDRNTQTIDALIVRNLDKPSYRQFIQLNNIEVASAPDRDAPPATFTVVQSRPTPCWDFGSTGVGGAVFPCPLGKEWLERPDDSNAFAPERGGDVRCMALGLCPPSQFHYYPKAKKYVIEVTPATQILDQQRRALTLRDIAMGDHLNIYGTLKVSSEGMSTGVIEAQVIRNLSKPIAQETGILRVVAYDGTLVCAQTQYEHQNITTPCGVIYHARVRLLDQRGKEWGTRNTERGEAVFEHLPLGTYSVDVSASGYYDMQAKAALTQSGAMETLLVALQSIKNSDGSYCLACTKQSGAIKVIAPNGGEVWRKGSTQTIQWKADAHISAVNIRVTAVSGGVACLGLECPPPPPKPIPFEVAHGAYNIGSFVWTVPQTLADGSYILSIASSANEKEQTELVDSSDGTFQITGTNTQGQ